MRIQQSRARCFRFAAYLLLASILFGCTQSEDEGQRQSRRREREPVPEIALPGLDGRNLVVVVMDSLRADHVGAYGYGRQTTPFLDSIAAEGLLFERAYAASSYTLQSVSALFTGRLPTSGGSIGLLESHPVDDAVTLPQRFRGAGYETGLVTNQPLLSGRGFTKGFFDVQITSPKQSWNGMEVTDRALEFIDLGEGSPFMLYVHYVEPHMPYSAPEDFKGGFSANAEPLNLVEFRQNYKGDTAQTDPQVEALVAAYDTEIAYADACLEALIAGLEERGLLADTLVVVTSNHGEEFLEHGYVGHAWTLNREVLHVPLVLYAPDTIPAVRIPSEVSHVDLYPTLLTLYGISPGDESLNGTSWFSSDNPGQGFRFVPPQKPVLSELIIKERCVLRSVIQDDWHYLSYVREVPQIQRYDIASRYTEIAYEMSNGLSESPELWGEPMREALYDLQDDPQEKSEISSAYPAIVSELRGALHEYRAFCEKNGYDARIMVHREPLMDTEDQEVLESLGYL